jgi:hypothetical protein
VSLYLKFALILRAIFCSHLHEQAKSALKEIERCVDVLPHIISSTASQSGNHLLTALLAFAK